jgi:hypothetical protein
MKYYDEFDNGQLCAYKHALHIIQDLYKKLEDPETNGELAEISYQEQYTAHQAKKDILDKAKAEIKQQFQSVQDNNYTDDDQYKNKDAHALYNEKACEEVSQDLTTSLSDLLDEATEENDFSIFSDMTPEQLGKRGWTWEVGKGMVRKPKPCCPHCHQKLWWE